MTASDLSRELVQGRTDYEFFYNGKRGSICPFNTSAGVFFADVSFAGICTTYSGINELMTAPFLDGKSLNEVAEEIELYG